MHGGMRSSTLLFDAVDGTQHFSDMIGSTGRPLAMPMLPQKPHTTHEGEVVWLSIQSRRLQHSG